MLVWAREVMQYSVLPISTFLMALARPRSIRTYDTGTRRRFHEFDTRLMPPPAHSLRNKSPVFSQPITAKYHDMEHVIAWIACRQHPIYIHSTPVGWYNTIPISCQFVKLTLTRGVATIRAINKPWATKIRFSLLHSAMTWNRNIVWW